MTPDELLKKFDNPSFEVNVGKSFLRLLEISITNQVYLRTILRTQLEIQELVKGKLPSEFGEEVADKMKRVNEKILEISGTEYHELLDDVLTPK